jgi:ribosomal protein S18 acetylase RimI-like enzyme
LLLFSNSNPLQVDKTRSMADIRYVVRGEIDNDAFNRVHAAAFAHRVLRWDWSRQFQQHSLTWVCAFDEDEVIGFVNLTWDGGVHGFLLDSAVVPDRQGQGIGRRLVDELLEDGVKRAPLEWIHVDSSSDLMDGFYRPAGFESTPAGLVAASTIRGRHA